jgi:hypothetical protein
MVEMYSEKLLSFAKEKFPALAGLAREFEEAMGDSYIYGHWRSTLVQDVMWFRGKDDAKSGRPERDVPSWSWASAADGSPIRFPQPILQRNISFEVVDLQQDRLTLFRLYELHPPGASSGSK